MASPKEKKIRQIWVMLRREEAGEVKEGNQVCPWLPNSTE